MLLRNEWNGNSDFFSFPNTGTYHTALVNSAIQSLLRSFCQLTFVLVTALSVLRDESP